MANLNTQDALFLSLESAEAPMHIAVLMTCRLPKGAPADYMQRLHERLSRVDVDGPPFNLRLVQRDGLSHLRPRLEVAPKVDIEYHLRHEALPWPGGQRELGLAISRLHSLPLQRSRPLWEFTLIEGLQRNRFALYLKIHHAIVDGLGLMRAISGALAETPQGKSLPPWAAPATAPQAARPVQAADDDWRRLIQGLLSGLDQSKPRREYDRAPMVPRGPRSILNGDTTSRRRVATQTLGLRRIKAIAKAADATINDVVLAVCSGALRAYLTKVDRVPRDSLLVSVPVALPRPDGETSGTSVASIHAPLATNVASARQRLFAIRDSMRGAKDEFRYVPVALHRAISSVGMQIMMLASKRAHADKDHSAFSTLTISNVPGPKQRLYFEGAEVEAMYPLSVLTGDQRINITLVSYRDQLQFGLVGCPDTLPHLQALAVQLPVALRELESEMRSAAVAVRRPPAKSRRRAARTAAPAAG